MMQKLPVWEFEWLSLEDEPQFRFPKLGGWFHYYVSREALINMPQPFMYWLHLLRLELKNATREK